ncbi:MAG: hypothetical protein ACI4GC_07305 [Acutalibacteraceae bacterium]
MIIAIAGSRGLNAPIPEDILPEKIDMIISGGARGIDICARNYAYKHRILIKEYLPDYGSYGRKAPIIRNEIIVMESDIVYVFWDGKSKGTRSVIDFAKQYGKPCNIFVPCENGYRPYNEE